MIGLFFDKSCVVENKSCVLRIDTCRGKPDLMSSRCWLLTIWFAEIPLECQIIFFPLEALFQLLGWIQFPSHALKLFSDSLKFEVKVLFAQPCPNLCDPRDSSLPCSHVDGIPQAIILKWVAIPLSMGSARHRD